MYRYHLFASFDKDLRTLEFEELLGSSVMKVQLPMVTSAGSFRYGLQTLINELRKLDIYPSETGFDAVIIGLMVYIADMKVFLTRV